MQGGTVPRNRVGLVVAAVLVLVLLTVFRGPSKVSAETSKTQAQSAEQQIQQIKRLRTRVASQRSLTWRWQSQSLTNRTPTVYQEKQATGLAYLRYLTGVWAKRYLVARQLAMNPPHRWLWMCIHSKEGNWNDPNAPYYGGLQMGHWFMDTYAAQLRQSLGTANNWSPLQQMWVAEKAFQREDYSRSWLFRQWPNTAPPCID